MTAPATPYVTEAGTEGPLVLCLHGIGSSSASFAAQLAGLSPVARVVAWDAPGYGRSADPDTAPGLDGYADAAAGLIRARGGSAHVIGVSWGGVIALRLALRHPDLVASLVVADSTRGSGADPEKAAAMRGRAAELAEAGPRAFAEARARPGCSRPAPRPSWSRP
ncbi:pimeloyl-ACP methyl ester carboxylesterase [Streptomyces sp. CZ24]|nr:pimeloyl-ACP methyl ester carboxylesterase [Streptomyces sp. CZ24]